MKVGPSKHLDAYLDTFDKKFVSYTRGRNTAADKPENQCMGTMEMGNALRTKYQKGFEGKIPVDKPNPQNENDALFTKMKKTHKSKWFDEITGWHQAASKAVGFIDTAKCRPDGSADPVRSEMKGKIEVKTREYDVVEIQGMDPGHGPFRVFKRPDDQSNKGGDAGKTPPAHVRNLALDAWKELQGQMEEPWKAAAKTALDAIPKG
jgi:hypothetical protein